MSPLTGTRLLRCGRIGIFRLRKNNGHPPTSEQAMILFTSSTQNIAAPASGGWNLRAIVRDMLNAWLAHHQRVADIGGAGHL
jgi:hypothetical protein